MRHFSKIVIMIKDSPLRFLERTKEVSSKLYAGLSF